MKGLHPQSAIGSATGSAPHAAALSCLGARTSSSFRLWLRCFSFRFTWLDCDTGSSFFSSFFSPCTHNALTVTTYAPNLLPYPALCGRTRQLRLAHAAQAMHCIALSSTQTLAHHTTACMTPLESTLIVLALLRPTRPGSQPHLWRALHLHSLKPCFLTKMQPTSAPASLVSAAAAAAAVAAALFFFTPTSVP